MFDVNFMMFHMISLKKTSMIVMIYQILNCQLPSTFVKKNCQPTIIIKTIVVVKMSKLSFNPPGPGLCWDRGTRLQASSSGEGFGACPGPTCGGIEQNNWM